MSTIEVVTRMITWIVVLAGVLAVYRWTFRRSRILAQILAAGIIGRAILGVALFTISLFELPVLTGLQTGGGFWTLAIDAHSYFNEAARAAQLGIGTVSDSAPSPTYLRALAAVMQILGISPATAILFNLACYLATAMVIVGVCRSSRVAAVVLGAITVNPALLIFGTQALKDPFCLAMLALAFGGVRLWYDALSGAAVRPRLLLGGAVLMSAGVYGIAGVRAYSAFFLILGIVAAAGVSMLVRDLAVGRWQILGANVSLVILLWAAFARGAGPYYPYYEGIVRSAVFMPRAPLNDLDHARAAFQATGGRTSFAEPEATGSLTVGDAGQGFFGRLGHMARGLAVMFIPISVLQTLSIVTFSGGRGMLYITDLDTLVVDLTVLGCLYLFAARWQDGSKVPVTVCVLVVAVVTCGAMAYVVTNFGTLFRLRLLVMAPLWLLPAVTYAEPRRRNAEVST